MRDTGSPEVKVDWEDISPLSRVVMGYFELKTPTPRDRKVSKDLFTESVVEAFGVEPELAGEMACNGIWNLLRPKMYPEDGLDQSLTEIVKLAGDFDSHHSMADYVRVFAENPGSQEVRPSTAAHYLDRLCGYAIACVSVEPTDA